MGALKFRILNVFTVPGSPLSGNPLAVFEDGAGLPDSVMLALARQFNLSETTFVLPATSPGATARVRIFTPTFEMPFAGHPTLGTAHVVRELAGAGNEVTLDMIAGRVAVTRDEDTWTLQTVGTLTTRTPEASHAELSAMLGIGSDAIGDQPLWVDTGSEQLVVPLRSPEAVLAARPRAELLARHGFSEKRGASLAYAWARVSGEQIVARFFFIANGTVVEDPATGSACANLGGWMVATEHPLPVRMHVRQGDAVGRPSRLGLCVDEQRRIFVTGQVVEIGRGTLTLD